MNYSEIEKLENECWDSQRKLRKAYLESIKDTIKEKGVDGCFEFDDDYPIITYDGGRHIEYASTLSNTVYSVFIKDEQLYANTEECDEYDESRMTLEDLEQIFHIIKTYE